MKSAIFIGKSKKASLRRQLYHKFIRKQINVSSSHSGVLMLTRFLASESKIPTAPLFFLQCTVSPENNCKIEQTTPVILMRQKP